MTAPLGLFQGFGIEIEYMIVDRDSLDVRPITDEFFKSVAGSYVSDIEDGPITWSNELVLHVVELKTTGPARQLDGLGSEFHRSAMQINKALERWNAMLLPTGMHPWMSPESETKLWPHDNQEVYEAYDRIFSCKGHGWSNLQSMHINLPFRDDEEFGKLHAAIRFLLPILPALSASSPLIENRFSGAMDSRLVQYQQNQKRIPSIAGEVIPEQAFSRDEYFEKILNRIWADIAPYDTDKILREDWLNSRGAIARWERQTIEIRTLDTQECPRADIAIAALVVETLRALISGSMCSTEDQMRFDAKPLRSIFEDVVQDAEAALIQNQKYLSLLGWTGTAPVPAGELWKSISARLSSRSHSATSSWIESAPSINQLLELGPLSRRIKNALPATPKRENVAEIYARLAECLVRNEMFR